MESSPIRPAFAAFGTFRKVQQREIHDPVGKGDRISNRTFHLVHTLQAEDPFVESCRPFEVGNLDRDVPDLAHDILRMQFSCR